VTWLLGALLGLGLSGTTAEPPSPEAVMAVPEEFAELARDAVGSVEHDASRRLDRLVDLFHDDRALGFEYAPHPTRGVAATYAARSGNCLAFTLAFLAVARELGFDAYPREVRVPDQWRRVGSSVLSVGHVNVGVDTLNRSAIVDFEPDLMEARRLAQPYRGRRISDERAMAHFYNNRAAELMLAGHRVEARLWTERAIALDPGFAPAHITRGVLARRAGQLAQAEAAFLQALESDEGSASALFNLVSLQRQRGRREEMIHYGRRLAALDPDDPYLLWTLGRLQRDLGEPELARESFARAVELTEANDPMLVAGLVGVLLELGETEAARRHLSRSGEARVFAKASKLKKAL
jgi:tetratricopeptide (TPR) repeat protein